MKRLTKKTYSIFWQHVMRHKLAFFVVTIGTAIASVLLLVPPLFYKEFFDTLSVANPGDAIARDLIIILLKIMGVYLVTTAIWRVVFFTNNYFQPIVMRDLSQTCFNYLHRHAPSYFHNSFVGSLVKRVNRYGRAFEGIIDLLTFNALRIGLDMTIIVVVLSTRSWVLGLSIAAWIVFFVVLNYFGARYKLKYDIQRAAQESKRTGVLADSITNHENIKLFNGYEREKKYFGATLEELRRLRKISWDLGQLFESIQVFFMILLEFGIMYAAVRLWQNGVLTLGDFVLIQSYVLMIFHKLWDVGRYIRHFYEHLADAEEMTEILETPHAIVDSKRAEPLEVEKGKIVFDNVGFRYNKTRKILSNFNLTINAGQRVAFVGHSGAGKSTIVKLLLRNHDVTRGKILIDGQRLSTATLESLWAAVSYVPQDPILFHRTLIENIRYGRPDATDAEVIEAAKQAHAHEFISQFPEGYNTYVGERGVKLSGGERQRVAIARAILRNAPILVLDEATSSLDSESESLIQDALDTLMKKKTVIVIAHRLSTIMKMDRIIVVEDGAIAEDGTHKQLVKKKNGFYKKLWDIQAGEFIGE